jgi:hypothetical protein
MSKLVDKERLARLAQALDGRMKAAVQAEKERAMQAEQANATAVANEKTRAEGVEGTLDAAIKAEAARATEVEGNLNTAIQNEASRADAAEKANKKAIEDEVARATGKENEIAGNLTKEIADREAAVEGVQKNLDDFEAEYAQDKQAQSQKDAAQEKAINDEVARAKAAEEVNAQAIAKEAQDRADAVKAVQDALDEFIGEDANGKSVAEQMKDMQDAMDTMEEELQDNIDAEAAEARKQEGLIRQELANEKAALEQSIAGEKSAREAADEALDGRMTAAEAKLTTIQGEGAGSIKKAEADAKAYTDEKIAALIDGAPEATNTLNELAEAIKDNKDVYDGYVAQHAKDMAAMKKELQDEIDADVLVEQQRAEAKEAELLQAIQTEAGRADTAEKKIAADLTKAVSDLQAEIDADVAVEAGLREAADNALQEAINAINSGTNGVLAQAKKYADEKDAALKADLQKEIDDDVKAEADRAKAEEADIRADFAAADAALKTELQAEIDSDVKVETDRAVAKEAELDAAIKAEATTARAAEKANADAIAVLNGDVNQVGSVDKKLADALASYTDTEDMMAILGNVVNSLALSMENDEMILKLGGVNGVAIHSTKLDLASDADIDAIIAGLDA